MQSLSCTLRGFLVLVLLASGCDGSIGLDSTLRTLCEASCTRGLECFPGGTLDECTDECVALVGPVSCDQNQAALEACVDGIGTLTCEEVGAGESPGLCDNVCLGNQLCDEAACESDGECADAACDPATGACVYFDAADGIACRDGRGACLEGRCAAEFPCTEQGILDAIAFGGGPNTFDCNGQTTVTTGSEIAIDNDVILDGAGELTVSGGSLMHRVFSVALETTAELRRITVTGGRAAVNGGGADQGGGIRNDGDLTLTDCLVSNNWASGEGGGILNWNELHLKDSIVVQNTAQSGGGVFNGDRMTMVESVMSGNLASSGGGITNRGDLELIDSTVSNNTASTGGGLEHRSGSLTVSGCTVADNTASEGCGGGLFLDFEATLNNSTVSGNVSEGEFACGGGIAVFDSVTLVNVTVADNQSSQSGSAIYVADVPRLADPLSVRAGIIQGNCASESAQAVRSEGYNVESPGDTCGFSSERDDQVSVDPESLGLGPLSDNGGPTETHALQSGSAALDQISAAECLNASGEPQTADQRGEPRPAELRCDSGAFEAQP